MAASQWYAYHSFKEFLGEKVIDFNNDTFKMALFESTGNAGDPTQSLFGGLTDQFSGSGYTAGGQAMTVTWTRSAGVVTFDSAPVDFTASGGAIVARYAVIYDDTPSSPAKPLVCFCLLDDTPADVSVSDGNTLTVLPHSSGILTLSGMAPP